MNRSTVVSYLAGAVAGFGVLMVAASPASALTAQECGAKYQAAKTAGTLNGQKWMDFRKQQCGADAAAAPAASEAKPDAKSEKMAEKKPEKKSAAKPDAAPLATGNASFPTAIDPKFAKEAPTRARLHTCAEQWKANKAANTTGGLKWIQRGGGYWSECNKRLKGVMAAAE